MAFFTSKTHTELGDALTQAFNKAVEKANSSQKPSEALRDCFRQHVLKRHPSQTHWHIDQINNERQLSQRNGLTAEVDINIPGAGRGYHDVDIFPKDATWLTIPLDQPSVRWSARSYADLFKPAGKDVLAVPSHDGQSLNLIFALSKHVHQAQTPEEMPSDDEAAMSLIGAWLEEFDNAFGEAVQSM